MNRPEIIVIGGGVIGSSITYYLSKMGKKVLMIEKKDNCSGSAGASDGVVGYHTKKPGLQMELAIRSIAMFEELSKELGMDIEYRKDCGGMQPAETKLEWEILSEIVKEQRQSGVDIRMISIEEACKIEPQLNPDLYGALYSPTSGKVNPIRLTFAYVQAAKRLGAQVLSNTEVTDVLVKMGRVMGVETSKGTYYADQVIDAAGSWAAEIAAMAGVDLPIRPRKGQLFITEPLGPFMDVTLQCARYNVIKFKPEAVGDKAVLRMGASLSIEQTENGGLVIGSTREFVGYDRENTLEAMEVTMRRAMRFFPALKDVNIIRAFAGLRPFTPDGIPVIGEVEKLPGFFVAAGHEGDGIALAPITGKLMAELLVQGKSSYPLEAFSPNRFRRWSEGDFE
ncbi:putative uncharacterized protein [Blautia hydrogenotrophica CAG:147]|uniref:NAD(P)/FAD-dependent oxidoreductase n=2 Tax=Blautia hydrogenotrophica TaxID=53443 RepID=UPI00033EFB7A|nr:FAD-binding oxidoreductase [Blautia hydrogenotrophica]MEE0463758.1 FAD-binding oxidoreductase [Blautia hydrogenotrophica]CCX59662.1 putative uncharacterized protein [Blautia hydrogenotrophica CAG:147]CUM98771.1 Glycine oxidase [Blautia hydrogenotrophica]SCH87533.1 Glycine oxidase [uncultured Blautia sp.]